MTHEPYWKNKNRSGIKNLNKKNKKKPMWHHNCNIKRQRNQKEENK